MRKFYGISVVVLCFAVSLAGCGGGGGGTAAPTGTTISGTVSAPSGVALGRSAGRSAAATGLVVKASVSVEAYLIDDSGNKSGSTLATATSTASGVYSLTLPVGTSAASNLVVVVGTGNNQMRSIVTSTTVNINPITELVTSTLVADAQPLSNFTVNEVTRIQDAVNSTAATTDLSAATTVSAAVTSLNNGDTAAQLNALVSEADSSINTSQYYAYFQIYKTYAGDSTTQAGGNIYFSVIGPDISAATATTPLGASYSLQYLKEADPNQTMYDGNKYSGKYFETSDTHGASPQPAAPFSTSELAALFPDGTYAITIKLTNGTTFTKNVYLSGTYPDSLTITSPTHNGTVNTLTPQIVWSAPGTTRSYIRIIQSTSPYTTIYEPSFESSESITSPNTVPSGLLQNGLSYYMEIQTDKPFSGNATKSIKRTMYLFTVNL